MNKQKSILLVMPANFGIYKAIEENLKFNGFHVITLAYDEELFVYPSISKRLKTKFRQYILQDKSAKHNLKSEVFQKTSQYQKVFRYLSETGGVGYALFIRADIWSEAFLKDIRSYIKKDMVAYQWDGMNRFPRIWQNLQWFDRFYVFDPKDLYEKSDKFLPITNFYLDYPVEDNAVSSDFYFIGSHLPDRRDVIIKFGQLAKSNGWQLDFNIVCKEKDIPKLSQEYAGVANIKLIHQIREFQDNLKAVHKAKALIDFVTSDHTGLSFRVFEALGYGKKLITTNVEVAHYDFYHPNNIFIWDGQDLEGIEAFMRKPYMPIDPDIKEKYSFSNWIRYILNLEPYKEITLP